MNSERKRKNILLVLDSLEIAGATRLCQEFTKVGLDYSFFVLGKRTKDFDPKNEFKAKKIFTYNFTWYSNIYAYLYFIVKTFLLLFKILIKEKIDVIIVNVHRSGLVVLLNPLSWFVKKIYFYQRVF